jgi:hypothetical protein
MVIGFQNVPATYLAGSVIVSFTDLLGAERHLMRRSK